MADAAVADNWKKRWDLPSPDVAFLQEIAPGCGREGPGSDIWSFTREKSFS